MSQQAAAAFTSLLQAQIVTITPTKFNNRISKEGEIPSWNSTPPSNRKEICKHQDAVAKSLFNRKRLIDLVGDQGDMHVGLTSSKFD